MELPPYETFGQIEHSQAQATVAEVRRLVGRDSIMAACWPRHGVSTGARPMGGYIDKSYDSSGSDSRRGSTNSRDPPRPAARAFAVLRSMTSSANDVSHVRLDSTMLGSSA